MFCFHRKSIAAAAGKQKLKFVNLIIWKSNVGILYCDNFKYLLICFCFETVSKLASWCVYTIEIKERTERVWRDFIWPRSFSILLIDYMSLLLSTSIPRSVWFNFFTYYISYWYLHFLFEMKIFLQYSIQMNLWCRKYCKKV